MRRSPRRLLLRMPYRLRRRDGQIGACTWTVTPAVIVTASPCPRSSLWDRPAIAPPRARVRPAVTITVSGRETPSKNCQPLQGSPAPFKTWGCRVGRRHGTAVCLIAWGLRPWRVAKTRCGWSGRDVAAWRKHCTGRWTNGRATPRG